MHYKGKYLGRYIYGYSRKYICETFCCPGGLNGYTFRDDFFLLDQYDNLIYRITQSELGCCAAWSDASSGLKYSMKICKPNGEVVGEIRKRLVRKCCNLCNKWIFDVTFPETCTPIHKLMLTYLIPFLNETYMNVWNSGDSHNFKKLKNDK